MTGCLPSLFSLCGVKQHVVVFIPGPSNDVTVEVKQRKHETGAYLHFNLEPRPRRYADTWDLFWAPLNEERPPVVARHQDDQWPQDYKWPQEKEDLQPLTQLTLDNLSLWERILRHNGFIQEGYVLDKASAK